MSIVDAIITKRDGGELSRRQVADFVRGASQGSVAPEQLAAMLMAICCRGMNGQETAWLTREMLDSGESWDLAADRPDLVDKHSTGGVGDTVSLVLAPLLASVGIPVAMMAGRGLGHSQGTLDKLETIPGFRVHWDRRGTLELIDRCGAAIVAQTDDIAPADRVLYAMRDVTGTVPSLPLIVGSIMSKKLALGVGTLILDVKWGSGAFRKTIDEAAELAAALRGVAREQGCDCEALITDMNQPLGAALGTANEVRAAREVLAGAGDQMLREVTLQLCETSMVLRGHDAAAARERLVGALDDGSALTAWEGFVRAHGGDPDPGRLAQPIRALAVTAPRAGTIAAVASDDLGWVAVDVGAGRRRRSEELDHAAGLTVQARIGDPVDIGQPLAVLELGERPVEESELVERVRAAFTIVDDEVEAPQLVLGTVDDVLNSREA